MHWLLWAFCILAPIAISMTLYGSILGLKRRPLQREESKEGKAGAGDGRGAGAGDGRGAEEDSEKKAEDSPPPFFFVTVWTLLYILQGFALATVAGQWSKQKPGSSSFRALFIAAITSFVAFVLLNCAYLIIQFQKEDQAGGLRVIYAMIGTLAVCICLFSFVSPLSGALLLPTGAFLTLASFLQRKGTDKRQLTDSGM